MKTHISTLLFFLTSAILSCSVFTSTEESDDDIRIVTADTLFTVDSVYNYINGRMTTGIACAIASRNDTLILFGREQMSIATSLDSLEDFPMKWANGGWGGTSYSDKFPSDYPWLVGNPDSLFITGNGYSNTGWRVNMNGYADYYFNTGSGRGEILWMGDYMGSPHKLLDDGSFDGKDSNHVSRGHTVYTPVSIDDSIYTMHSAKEKEMSDTLCATSINTGVKKCEILPVAWGSLFSHNGELGIIDWSSSKNRSIQIRRENNWIKLKASREAKIALGQAWIGRAQTSYLGKTILYSEHGVAVVQGDSVIFRGMEGLEYLCFGKQSIAIWKDRLILPGYGGTVLALPLSEINSWN